MRRAWAVGMDCVRALAPEAVVGDYGNRAMWSGLEFVTFSTFRDKGLARLVAAGYGRGGRVQRATATTRHATKNDGARYAWADPQDPPPGIMRRTLRRILARRASFGGRKGRRAARRLKEMTR